MSPHSPIPRAGPARSQAFTQVELLVAVAIIGILSAILFVTITRIRESADKTKCASNLRAIATAGLMWISDHKGSMPDAMFWRVPNQSNSGSFLPYLGYTDGMGTVSNAPTLMSCPASFKAVGPNPDWNRGYSINIYACKTENGVWPPVSPYSRQASNIGQIASPARMAFIMDANFLATGVPERKVYNSNTGVIWKELGTAGLFTHPDGTVNVAFLDGHIRAMNPLTEFPKGTPDAQRLAPFWGSLQ